MQGLKNTSKMGIYKLNRLNELTNSLFSATNKMCLQLLWPKLNFWRALRKRSPATMESMDGHSSRWLLGRCLHCGCKSWFPTFASWIFSFCKSDLLLLRALICSFCKSDLLLLRVGFALLQVGFVPFALSWFPPFGSGRQNWTGRRQNAVTNRPETGLWQPGEYSLAHHF